MAKTSDQILIDEISELKQQVNSLQQFFTEVKVNTKNNLHSIEDIEERLRMVETDLKVLANDFEHIKSSKIEIDNSISLHSNTIKELQGEVNQIRLVINTLSEKHSLIDKKEESVNGIVRQVLTWFIITAIILLTYAVTYTVTVTKNSNNNNVKTIKNIIEEEVPK